MPLDIIQSVYREKVMGALPYRDKFGRRVCLVRPGFWNPDKIAFSELYSALFQLCEMVAKEDKSQIAGCTIIMDAKNFGFKQLRNIAIEDIRVAVNFVQVKLYIKERLKSKRRSQMKPTII